MFTETELCTMGNIPCAWLILSLSTLMKRSMSKWQSKSSIITTPSDPPYEVPLHCLGRIVVTAACSIEWHSHMSFKFSIQIPCLILWKTRESQIVDKFILKLFHVSAGHLIWTPLNHRLKEISRLQRESPPQLTWWKTAYSWCFWRSCWSLDLSLPTT